MARSFSSLNFDCPFDVGTPSSHYSFPYKLLKSGTITSSGNWGYQSASGTVDVGSNFLLERTSYETSLSNVSLVGDYPDRFYRGTQLPVAPGGTEITSGMALPSWSSVYPTLITMGATAIAQTTPTNPKSGVLNFVGELYRDGIPSLVGSGLLKSRLKDYREYGSEYLNVEFGWKPFVSDIRKILRSVQESEKILAQFRKDSGQLIHRRYDFPSSYSTSLSQLASTTAWPDGTDARLKDYYKGNLPQGPIYVMSTYETKTWFEGAYRYVYPMGDSLLDKFSRFSAEANKLYGLRLTPEVLWNLTPWTWLGDWVSNMGDVIHNISALGNDSLVMTYGYMMQHSKNVRTCVMPLKFPRKDGVSSLDLTYVVERKARVKATPYGFGITWDGFTPRQWAILASIGISNNRKTSK